MEPTPQIAPIIQPKARRPIIGIIAILSLIIGVMSLFASAVVILLFFGLQRNVAEINNKLSDDYRQMPPKNDENPYLPPMDNSKPDNTNGENTNTTKLSFETKVPLGLDEYHRTLFKLEAPLGATVSGSNEDMDRTVTFPGGELYIATPFEAYPTGYKDGDIEPVKSTVYQNAYRWTTGESDYRFKYTTFVGENADCTEWTGEAGPCATMAVRGPSPSSTFLFYCDADAMTCDKIFATLSDSKVE